MASTPHVLSHLDRARALAAKVPPALRRDGERAYADALLAQMRQDELLNVLVSAEHGGPSLSVADTARIIFHAAKQSGSAGLICAMHMSQVLSIVRHGKGAYFDSFQRRMVKEQLLVASGTTEKGPGGDILQSFCTITNTPDGQLIVTKESPNISYIDHAGALLVTANHVGANGKPRQVLFVAENHQTRFTPGKEASMMGMRGMLNCPWTFTSTFSADAIFPVPFSTIARRTMTPGIQIFWAALWSGIAADVLERAKVFVQNEIKADTDGAHITSFQLSRLINLHYIMNTLIRDAISAFEPSDTAPLLGWGVRFERLKVSCSEMLEEICKGALHIVGIRGYAAGGPYSLSTQYADALSAAIMISNTRLVINAAKVENYAQEEL